MVFEVASPLPERIHPGLIILHRVRPLFGLPVTWVTEITQLVEGELFVDEQRFGPYRFWHHQHHFRPVEGGVEIGDIVHYALPLGPLGDVLDRLLVAERVRAIFEYRRAVLERRFGRVGAADLAAAGAGRGGLPDPHRGRGQCTALPEREGLPGTAGPPIPSPLAGEG